MMRVEKETLFELIRATGRELPQFDLLDIIGAAYARLNKSAPTDELYDLDIIGNFLNIPLQVHADSIKMNYMKMQTTRQFILQTYPLQQKKKNIKELAIPEPMNGILAWVDKYEIWQYWQLNFNIKPIK